MKEELIIKTLCQGIEAGDSTGILSSYCEFASIVNPLIGTFSGRDSKYLALVLNKFLHSIKIEYDIVNTHGPTISVHWQMKGILRLSEKVVACNGKTVIKLSNARILTQVDSFNFWKLSRSVCGTSGLLFGWSPVFRSKFQKKARKEVGIISSFYKSQRFSPLDRQSRETYSAAH